MTEWQPIETAPKDGRSFLGCSVLIRTGERTVYECVFRDGHFYWQGDNFDPFSEQDDEVLTHWMPLPEAPA